MRDGDAREVGGCGRWLDCRQRKGDGPRGRGGEVVLDKEFGSNIITVPVGSLKERVLADVPLKPEPFKVQTRSSIWFYDVSS